MPSGIGGRPTGRANGGEAGGSGGCGGCGGCGGWPLSSPTPNCNGAGAAPSPPTCSPGATLPSVAAEALFTGGGCCCGGGRCGGDGGSAPTGATWAPPV